MDLDQCIIDEYLKHRKDNPEVTSYDDFKAGFISAHPKWIPPLDMPIGEPCLIKVKKCPVQHITYMRNSRYDVIVDWFEPVYFGDDDVDPIDYTDVECCLPIKDLIPQPPEVDCE